MGSARSTDTHYGSSENQITSIKEGSAHGGSGRAEYTKGGAILIENFLLTSWQRQVLGPRLCIRWNELNNERFGMQQNILIAN